MIASILNRLFGPRGGVVPAGGGLRPNEAAVRLTPQKIALLRPNDVTMSFVPPSADGGAEMTHTLTLKPQPIADQWMGECSCGWRHTASLLQFDTREAAIDDIETAHLIHLDN